MRKFISNSAIIFILFASISVFAQGPSKPELPDFTKSPYTLVAQDDIEAKFHPEWGFLPGKIYEDENSNNEDTQNLILILFNQDGTHKYAEWLHSSTGDLPNGQVKRLMRSYIFKNGKFVFEQEKELSIK